MAHPLLPAGVSDWLLWTISQAGGESKPVQLRTRWNVSGLAGGATSWAVDRPCWVGAHLRRAGRIHGQALGALSNPKMSRQHMKFIGLTIHLSSGLCPVPGTQQVLNKYLMNESMWVMDPPPFPPLAWPLRHSHNSQSNLGDCRGREYDSVSSMLFLLFRHQTSSVSLGLPMGWEYNIHQEKDQGLALNYKCTNVMEHESSFQVHV